MKTLLCFGIALFSCFYSLGQNAYEHGVPFYPIPVKGHHYVNIQYLELNKNNFILKEIKKYIQEQVDSSALFKAGFGFITVDNIIIPSNDPYFLKKENNVDHNTGLKFRLGTRSFLLTQSFVTLSSYCTGCFPDFYSVINDRLVLIYSDQSRWLHQGYFSEDSKKELIALQKRHLQQALDPNFVFIDFFGGTFKIDTDERSRLTEEEIILKASLRLQATKTVIQSLEGQIEYRF